MEPPNESRAFRSTRVIKLAVGGAALLVFALLGSSAFKAGPAPASLESEEIVVAPKLVYDPTWNARQFETIPDKAWVSGPNSGMAIDPTNDNVFLLSRSREPEMLIHPGGPDEVGPNVLSLPILLGLIFMVLPFACCSSCCTCCSCSKACAGITFKVASAILLLLIAIAMVFGIAVFGRTPIQGTGVGSISCATDCAGPPWTAAPFVQVYDKEGSYLNGWGGPGDGYDWPYNPHTITVDEEYVWISGGLPNPHEYELPVSKTHDTFILKFTKTGEFVMQMGTPYTGSGTTDLHNFNRPCGHKVKGDELYVADGHGYVRIAVLDKHTGELKRQWGGYGLVPNISLPEEQRYGRTVHGVAVSNDGYVYVCDRNRGLIFVHLTDGTYVSELDVLELPTGVAHSPMQQLFPMFSGPWSVEFSPDAEQKYLFVATIDQMLFVLDRASMSLLTTTGSMGQTPGLFFGMHSIATNSDGDVFVSEINHGRLQKFKNLGETTFPKYAHLPSYTEEPPPQSGPRYMGGAGITVGLMHIGCPKSDILKTPIRQIFGAFIDAEKECTDDSWLW